MNDVDQRSHICFYDPYTSALIKENPVGVLGKTPLTDTLYTSGGLRTVLRGSILGHIKKISW